MKLYAIQSLSIYACTYLFSLVFASGTCLLSVVLYTVHQECFLSQTAKSSFALQTVVLPHRRVSSMPACIHFACSKSKTILVYVRMHLHTIYRVSLGTGVQ